MLRGPTTGTLKKGRRLCRAGSIVDLAEIAGLKEREGGDDEDLHDDAKEGDHYRRANTVILIILGIREDCFNRSLKLSIPNGRK